jgi:hypothetical protein
MSLGDKYVKAHNMAHYQSRLIAKSVQVIVLY